MERFIQVVTGCTAVGKTEWALRRAEDCGAEIVSCDSMLFYRGMDIGTAKPTPAERSRVPHHLVDIREVDAPMDISAYVTEARRAAEEISARGRRVLVVGGSGFYLKSFFSAVADDVAVAPGIRSEVRGMSPGAALTELQRLNPAGLGTLDQANPRRVARALERCRASGRTVLELEAEFARRPSPFADWKVELVRLERSPEALALRIDRRVEAMLASGLLDEARGLLAAGLTRNPSAARAIGYRECIDVLEGRLDPARLAGEIARNTRALVRKQRTWFRTQLPVGSVIELS